MDDVKLDYYVTTYSGNRIYIANPDPDAVLLSDIAHQLGMTCRFGGATIDFYAVAQHSSLAYYVAKDAKLNVPTRVACLLHDGNEGAYPDIQRPIKEYLGGGWAVVEQPLETVIYEKYLGKYVNDVDWDALKKIDNILCVYEGRALLKQADWTWDEKWVKYFDDMPYDFDGNIYMIDPLFEPTNPKDSTYEFNWNLRHAAGLMVAHDPEWTSIYNEVVTK